MKILTMLTPTEYTKLQMVALQQSGKTDLVFFFKHFVHVDIRVVKNDIGFYEILVADDNL